MKIGISALTLSPGRAGGIEIYFRNLLENLQKIDSQNVYSIFVQPELINQLELHSDNFNTIILREPFGGKLLRKTRLSSRTSEDNLIRVIADEKCDVIHFPLHVIYPKTIPGKKIISVMDIQEKYWPEFFSKEDLASRQQLHDSSIKSADHIIAISQFTKNTIVEKLNIKPSKISVVHLAYNEEVFSINKIAAPKKHMPSKFFFYPAATWPHKNHLRLLEAFAQLSEEFSDFHLVLSGIKMQQTDKIKVRVKELDIESKVHLIGYVEEEELPWYYRNAYALVFPSLFEGFGIPLLEAMVSKCPIIASKTTSIPEVAGDAAHYFDPLNPGEIAKAMRELIVNKKLRSKLIEKGEERVKAFSSKKTAELTLDVYRKVLS